MRYYQVGKRVFPDSRGYERRERPLGARFIWAGWPSHRMSTKIRQVYGSWLDPRPDLEEDAELWAAVLAEAMRQDPHPDDAHSVFGLLHGLRCGGAQLNITESGAIRLDYSALTAQGLWSDKELRSKWLLPAADTIKKVFARIESRIQCKINTKVPIQVAVGM